MRPFAKYREVMKWLCLCPADENTTINKRRAYIAFALLNFMIGNVGGLLSSVVYFATSTENSMLIFLQILLSFNLLYSITVAFRLRSKLNAILDQLDDIYETYENDDLFQFLENVNTKCEWITHVYIQCIMGALIILSMLAAVSVIVSWFRTGEINVDTFFHPIYVALPWGQATFIGFIGEICYTLLVVVSYITSSAVFVILFIGVCLHHQAISKMFQHMLNRLDDPDKGRDDHELLCNLIRFHMQAKDWFEATASFFSPVFVIFFCSMTLSLAIDVYQIDAIFNEMDYVLASFVLSFFYIIAHIFAYCFLGKLASLSYEQMADDLYNAKWYKLHVRRQKYFILLIACAQRPMEYHGFGIVILKLETFTRILNSVYKYYMILKTLAGLQ